MELLRLSLFLHVLCRAIALASSGYVLRCVDEFKWDEDGKSTAASSCIPIVRARFDDTISDRGFGSLQISTLQYGGRDEDYFYAMGYAEGILTAKRVRQQVYNMIWTKAEHPALNKFLEDHLKYMQERAEAESSDPYWIAVRFVMQKAEGLRYGLLARNVTEPQIPDKYHHRQPSDLDILKLQLVSDLDDMTAHLDRTYNKSDTKGHCSALIQLTPSGQVIVGHATWTSYNEMLRIYKSFDFSHVRSPAIVNKRMSMSSYPGYMMSTDDWVTLPDKEIVILETTNDCLDPELLSKKVSHASVSTPYRAFAATLLAKDGVQWYQHFSRLNSGTQNNQWMIVNLRKGTLFVIEQMPGLMTAQDMTEMLRTNRRWASFNQCFFDKTCKASAYYERRTPLSACESNRATLFHNAVVESVQDMQKLLTTNDWLETPFSEGCPRCVIASRFDIGGKNPKIKCGRQQREAFGAIDAKVTSSSSILQDETLFISGPARGPGVPVFQWSTSGLEAPHIGHPDRWDFGWYSVGNEVADVNSQVASPETEYVLSQQYI